ncbi:MAG: ATP-binding cassette domain-containing protein [Saprospiraceae bacterium]|nr:ATP-binding cassette domain-containing protein [Saprospiraceae bacterium]
MEIELIGLSKRYGYQWILRDVNQSFFQGNIYGVSGRNGIGKSTLIKLISGFLSPSSGQVVFKSGKTMILPQNFHQYFVWVAPYTDLIQEYTLSEMFLFHKKFKTMPENLDVKTFLEYLQWQNTGDKQIRFFSSGMKQKLQLALALLSETPILLLDEPTSYLDESAKLWFAERLKQETKNRITIISSNDRFDLDLCQNVLDVTELSKQ